MPKGNDNTPAQNALCVRTDYLRNNMTVDEISPTLTRDRNRRPDKQLYVPKARRIGNDKEKEKGSSNDAPPPASNIPRKVLSNVQHKQTEGSIIVPAQCIKGENKRTNGNAQMAQQKRSCVPPKEKKAPKVSLHPDPHNATKTVSTPAPMMDHSDTLVFAKKRARSKQDCSLIQKPATGIGNSSSRINTDIRLNRQQQTEKWTKNNLHSASVQPFDQGTKMLKPTCDRIIVSNLVKEVCPEQCCELCIPAAIKPLPISLQHPAIDVMPSTPKHSKVLEQASESHETSSLSSEEIPNDHSQKTTVEQITPKIDAVDHTVPELRKDEVNLFKCHQPKVKVFDVKSKMVFKDETSNSDCDQSLPEIKFVDAGLLPNIICVNHVEHNATQIPQDECFPKVANNCIQPENKNFFGEKSKTLLEDVKSESNFEINLPKNKLSDAGILPDFISENCNEDATTGILEDGNSLKESNLRNQSQITLSDEGTNPDFIREIDTIKDEIRPCECAGIQPELEFAREHEEASPCKRDEIWTDGDAKGSNCDGNEMEIVLASAGVQTPTESVTITDMTDCTRYSDIITPGENERNEPKIMVKKISNEEAEVVAAHSSMDSDVRENQWDSRVAGDGDLSFSSFKTIVGADKCRANSTAIIASADDGSWDAIYDDSGECLDKSVLAQLATAVGDVSIEVPKIDYLSFQTKEPQNSDEDFGHVVEIYNFPVEFKTEDLMSAFSNFKDRGFNIKWVNDTHALGVFSSRMAAEDALSMQHPIVSTRPLSQGIKESKQKARRAAEFLQPYKARPETSAHLARRMVASALGMQVKVSDKQREEDRRKLREAKERRQLAIRQRQEAWEGSVGND